MSVIIKFDRLFVSSERLKYCFYEEFCSGLNIISGRNTSGKSSLIQSLIYTFGVNDVAENLSEILECQPTFRVDFTKFGNGIEKRYTIIRESKSIYVREEDGKVVPFHGIDADNSVEHVKLKEYISDIVDFKLVLEQKGELKPAPLESMFLPYYISQSVGWVYLRDSFSNLQYYKGFKDDYLDYFLGINNKFDRVHHRRLSQKRDQLLADINNLKRFSEKSEIQFSKLVDEAFGEQAQEYINMYIQKSDSLEQERSNYIKLCNELSLLQNHHRILKRTKRNIKKQNYNDVDRCPACTQVLSYSLEGLYSHYQKYNDTVELVSHITEKLINKKSKIHSSRKRIDAIKKEITNSYGSLLEKNVEGVTLEQWLANKANITLYQKIQTDYDASKHELESVKETLNAMTTENETIVARCNREREFKEIFSDYMTQLALKPLSDKRYLDLYKIQSFPRQGVELHKTVMAYHFALNAMITRSKAAHRLPFLLDAILKEDIDDKNLVIILKFVGKNIPEDTQTFVSISEHIEDESKDKNGNKLIDRLKVKEVKKQYFSEESKLFYIGGGQIERGFLSQPLESYAEIHMDTIDITS